MVRGKSIFRNSELQREVILFFLKNKYLKPFNLSNYLPRSYSEVYRQHNNLIKQGIISIKKETCFIDNKLLKKICLDELQKQENEYMKKTKFYREILEELNKREMEKKFD